MKLKPWFLVLVVFVIIDLGADAVIKCMVLANPESDAGRIAHLYAEQGDEIPIFGASKVYEDYIPAEMGINAYNYGSSAAGYEVADALLQIELAKPKTSPIIIDFKPNATRASGDPRAYIPFVLDPRIRFMLKQTGEMEWQYWFPGLRYFGHYDDFIDDFIDSRILHQRQATRGYLDHRWVFDRAAFDAAFKIRQIGFFSDEDQNRRLLARINAHPKRLFFLVYSPIHSSCYENFKNLDQFEAFKAKLSAPPNVVFLDYGRMKCPDEYFDDPPAYVLRRGRAFFQNSGGKDQRNSTISRRRRVCKSKRDSAKSSRQKLRIWVRQWPA